MSYSSSALYLTHPPYARDHTADERQAGLGKGLERCVTATMERRRTGRQRDPNHVGCGPKLKLRVGYLSYNWKTKAVCIAAGIHCSRESHGGFLFGGRLSLYISPNYSTDPNVYYGKLPVPQGEISLALSKPKEGSMHEATYWPGRKRHLTS